MHPWILKSCLPSQGDLLQNRLGKYVLCISMSLRSRHYWSLVSAFHLLSTLAKMLNSRLTYSNWPSFLWANDLSHECFFKLGPVIGHDFTVNYNLEVTPRIRVTSLIYKKYNYACTRAPSHAHTLTDTHPCDLLLWCALAFLSVWKQSCPQSLRLASPVLIRAPTCWRP